MHLLCQGNALLIPLADQSVHCVVTSPPYWGLRDYSCMGQLGLEPTPEQYITNMVEVFREVKRVLRDDGTCWVNIGDGYASSGVMGDTTGLDKYARKIRGQKDNGPKCGARKTGRCSTPNGLKPKDLIGIPWRLALALQAPYYTGSIRDEKDRIWLAAMLDTEGCMFIHKRKAGQNNGQGYQRQNDSYGPGVEIANTHESIINRIMAIVGKGSICSQGPEENNRRKQRIYRWNLRLVESRDFVRELYPYLIAKQHQARILIGCPTSGPQAEAVHAALIGLHNGATVDLDFPEPKPMLEPGWYVRSDIIWSKLNPMPESVTDRPTKSHEYLFLLSKSERYYFDAEAVREPHKEPWRGTGEHESNNSHNGGRLDNKDVAAFVVSVRQYNPAGRNIRTVWTIPTESYAGAHFATFPRKLVEPCVKAGTSEKGCCPVCGKPWERVVERGNLVGVDRGGNYKGREYDVDAAGVNRMDGSIPFRPGMSYENKTTGWRPDCDCVTESHFRDVDGHLEYDLSPPASVPCVIFDPFIGSGTTIIVANALGRHGIGLDLSAEYLQQAKRRITRPHSKPARPIRAQEVHPLFDREET